MRFLINFATRSRSANFIRAIESVSKNFSNENSIQIIVSADTDDKTMNNDDLRSSVNLSYNGIVRMFFGESTGKINAINREIDKFGDNWDVLINLSDDMVFTEKDFDKIIASKIGDDTDKYLHFRDTNHKQPDALCTLHIVGKKYFDRDGFIYHFDYISVWADNWNDTVAKARKKYSFHSEVIFNHIHPAYGKTAMDEQYKKTEDKIVYRNDHRTYRRMLRNLKQYV